MKDTGRSRVPYRLKTGTRVVPGSGEAGRGGPVPHRTSVDGSVPSHSVNTRHDLTGIGWGTHV